MNKAHLTAIGRTKVSAPTRFLLDNVVMEAPLLDYGCGRGIDAQHLKALCPRAVVETYDPYFQPDMPNGFFKTVLCHFVLNVIPDQLERDAVIYGIRAKLAKDGVAYISVRNDKKNLNGLTTKGTWQGHITLNLPIIKQTSSYTLYRLTK